MQQEAKKGVFFTIIHAFSEQVYRVDRDIGISTPEMQRHRIEIAPSIHDWDKVGCDIDVAFPTVRDPGQFPQISTSTGQVTYWDTIRGKYEIWVLYQGTAINYNTYFRQSSASRIIKYLTNRNFSPNDAKFLKRYTQLINEKEITATHVECEGFTITTIKAR